ncbi:MAG: nucleotidyltransferase [Bryobacterales bacterium]|nr:nucleotidyltransferase [Bryobacterales bacterium]
MIQTQTTIPLNQVTLSDLLGAIADGLDIPEELYEEATLKYEEVGIWLAEDEQGLGRYSPEIYPQGSFRLGTVVRPIDPACDYDIDLVCHLDIKEEATTQKDLKDMVGKRLRENAELAKIISPSRRCWNLDYPKQFHMDVLPAIPNAERLPDGILLTDTELVRWQKSNPKAYANWFYQAIAIQFERKRAELAKALSASVEDVPEWRVKTPLQRAVQLLKRHRDNLFRGDLDNRPVSIIITTLAARAYRNQDNVYDALTGLVADMPGYIENRNGRWWVANPVEPEENFADKWNEKPERRLAFLRWLDQVRNDIEGVVGSRTLDKAAEALSHPFGTTAVGIAEKAVLSRHGIGLPAIAVDTRPLPAVNSDVPHCQQPRWPERSRYKVDIRGSLHMKRRGPRIGELARRRISKRLWLRFSIRTNTPGPYTVHWQVVNTGEDAARAGQLRGDFYPSEDNAADVRWETTAYSGVHWVEAFVVKDGVCVARSGKKYVTVA